MNKKLKGDIVTYSAVGLSIIAAIFTGLLKRFLDEYQDDILTFAGSLTAIAGILAFIGSRITEKENQRQLKEQYDDNTNRIDKLHTNYNHDIKEAFGLISKRTAEDFLSEKTPRHMSQDQTDDIAARALNKWINENVGQHWDEGRPILIQNGDHWTFQNHDWIRFTRNSPVIAQNIHMFFDTYSQTEGPPTDHKFIHVIINSGIPSDSYGIGANLTEQAKELYYKYGRWWDEYSVSYQTHQSSRHVVIIVSDDVLMIPEFDADSVRAETNFWMGEVVHRPALRLDKQIFLYSMSDTSSTEVVFK